MLPGVGDTGSLEDLFELRLLDPALDLMKILEIISVLHDNVQDVLLADLVANIVSSWPGCRSSPARGSSSVFPAAHISS